MRRRFFNNNIKYFDINDYLTIEALEDNLQVYFPYEDLMYGIDGVGWKKLIAGAYSPAINKGQTISFKGSVISSVENVKSFTITKNCNLLGNCMAIASDETLSLRSIFRNCTTIISVSKDFLPATTLAIDCYESMFLGCTSLTTAPELPATTLADSCYNRMFLGCTKLNYIKMLAVDISAYACLYDWVSGVSSTGTFVKSKDATWDVRGNNGIPTGWTVITE